MPTSPSEVSTLSQDELANLRQRFLIPSTLECRIPEPDEVIFRPQEGEIAFYSYFFNLGVRLPLQLFSANYLDFFTCAHPN